MEGGQWGQVLLLPSNLFPYTHILLQLYLKADILEEKSPLQTLLQNDLDLILVSMRFAALHSALYTYPESLSSLIHFTLSFCGRGPSASLAHMCTSLGTTHMCTALYYPCM